MSAKVIHGDCLAVLRTMPDESVHCCVTSPPYFGLRDYGVEGQYGLEKTPEEYVAKMVEVFREVRRVLRKDGTFWLNVGDSYNGSGGVGGVGKQHTNHGSVERPDNRAGWPKLKLKELCGIPWRLAFALQEDGWLLRQDIIWYKPNPMPESVTDRCTKSHEYIFLLSKSAKYFYDVEAVKEKSTDKAGRVYKDGHKSSWKMDKSGGFSTGRINDGDGKKYGCPESGRNKRSVWTVPTCGFSEAHFATFPPALIEPCILAGTSATGCCPTCGAPWERVVEKKGGTTGKSWHDHKDDLGKGMSQPGKGALEKEGGEYSVKTIGWRRTCKHDTTAVPCTVLDPFIGSGTTAIVAVANCRNCIGIELNPHWAKRAAERVREKVGLLCQ